MLRHVLAVVVEGLIGARANGALEAFSTVAIDADLLGDRRLL